MVGGRWTGHLATRPGTAHEEASSTFIFSTAETFSSAVAMGSRTARITAGLCHKGDAPMLAIVVHAHTILAVRMASDDTDDADDDDDDDDDVGADSDNSDR